MQEHKIHKNDSRSGSEKNPVTIRKIRIQEKKRPKNVSTSRKIVYFICSTLNTVLFGQVSPKPNQKHHLDPIKLLMDGSGRIRISEKPGSETLIMILIIRAHISSYSFSLRVSH